MGSHAMYSNRTHITGNPIQYFVFGLLALLLPATIEAQIPVQEDTVRTAVKHYPAPDPAIEITGQDTIPQVETEQPATDTIPQVPTGNPRNKSPTEWDSTTTFHSRS
jgi:hypothetical protein